MGHTHSHQHTHNVTHVSASLYTAYKIAIAVTALYIIAEVVAGIWQKSMGLLADAGHNLSDAVALLLSFLAVKLSKRAENTNYTYGYKKSTILVSLLNALILTVAIVGIIVESVGKFINPEPLEGLAISTVAGIGIVIKIVTAYLFIDKKEGDLNVKGAYLHTVMDALVAIGVVIAGVVIHYTGWSWIDPLIGVTVACILATSTWPLLRQSIRLAMDGVPEGIDSREIEKELESVSGVVGVHHIHIWALSTTENALTAHLLLAKEADIEAVKAEAKRMLEAKGIGHATLEAETVECDNQSC